MPPRSLHVAVIGAGAAGLVAASELRREGHSPVVFERAAGVGGTWLYDPAASADLLGAGAVHSSVYASLRTNLSRECFGFSDFPFIADEGVGDGDRRRFPGHQEVLRYLQEFARRFDLYGMVRLRTEVASVRREASASWRVTSHSTSELAGGGGPVEEVFDAVVVCNGHFVTPRVVTIAGIGSWPGKQIHSHSYRVPEAFHGQVVVIVGYATSGFDISRDIAGVAREVHVAAATCVEMQRTARPNLWLHPMIERAEADGSVVFQDGNRVKADAIIHCTGYKYSYPFLDEEVVGISVDDNRVGPLYKHVFPPHLAPHISFIGLPFRAILFPLFELQSNWVAGILSGRIKLPSQEKMMEDVAEFYSKMEARGCPKRLTHDFGACTFEYEEWVAEQCGKEMMEGWRKAMYLAARKNMVDRPENWRDEWEDAHLLSEAYQDLTKYF